MQNTTSRHFQQIRVALWSSPTLGHLREARAQDSTKLYRRVTPKLELHTLVLLAGCNRADEGKHVRYVLALERKVAHSGLHTG